MPGKERRELLIRSFNMRASRQVSWRPLFFLDIWQAGLVLA